MRLPDFVIIGAMRSGTTTLTKVLDTLPTVAAASGKELHFFDDHYARGFEWYAGHFAGLPRGVKAFEATPNYMHDREAWQRLLVDLPQTQLVAILRNPIDRSWSHYWFNVSRHKETLSFEEALDAEAQRLQTSRFEGRVYSYLSRSRYAETLVPISHAGGDGRLHVLYLEDFLAEPGAEIERLLWHLGAETTRQTAEVSIPQVNKYVEFRSLRVRDLARRLPRLLGRVIGRLNARTRVTYPSMKPETRARLRQEFADDVSRLVSLVGREPRRWRDFHPSQEP